MSRKRRQEDLHRRRAGILLHLTSLPRNGYDGPLGETTDRFLEFLNAGGFTIWQMLPVNSIADGGSPYQGTSVHAGNSRLISVRQLADWNWLDRSSLVESEPDLATLIRLLSLARAGFERHAADAERDAYHGFKRDHAAWLEDYACYSVIRQEQDNRPWWQWPDGLRRRDPGALAAFTKRHAGALEDYRFEQYVFYRQWNEFRARARQAGILLFGDMPIFVAHDSVDVWANQESFLLDTSGQPTVVAGVPPDYFSSTGQRWGNPLYEWNTMRGNDYSWWVSRVRTQLRLFDLLRIDHFRGFVSLWEIPVHCATAIEGKWVDVPGRELLTRLWREFDKLPLIAEDLDTISEEVLNLRDDFGLPGMKVLEFAFDSDNRNPYLPHNHVINSIVYTGTHDNDTTVGWFKGLDPGQCQYVLDYLGHPAEPMPWPLIVAALQSVSRSAILPMQDILGLDGDHRMNTPGTTAGNWQWRFEWEWVLPELAGRLRHLNGLYGRL